ncbi:hypothetical protein M440DRAFT_1199745 [Trichoderma longibrachiatum ATCC 18648]|uniref:Uncharacterized protein n=1 Tax=Trichoderma longibrachiatum ATCC 18648 TaxID=983965 RepID=A0A2T4CAU1_TRILO|nr:hypothetical protein M440DRAFT_1199745 [Trichoderma longibrachiatum ATCC 18648]
MGFAAPPHHADVTLLASPCLCPVARSSVSAYCEHRGRKHGRGALYPLDCQQSNSERHGEAQRQAIHVKWHDSSMANLLRCSQFASASSKSSLLTYEHKRSGVASHGHQI